MNLNLFHLLYHHARKELLSRGRACCHAARGRSVLGVIYVAGQNTVMFNILLALALAGSTMVQVQIVTVPAAQHPVALHVAGIIERQLSTKCTVTVATTATATATADSSLGVDNIIVIAVHVDISLGKKGYSVAPSLRHITISGGDVRGLHLGTKEFFTLLRSSSLNAYGFTAAMDCYVSTSLQDSVVGNQLQGAGDSEQQAIKAHNINRIETNGNRSPPVLQTSNVLLFVCLFVWIGRSRNFHFAGAK